MSHEPLFYAEYACGNRFYFTGGEDPPEDCPCDGHSAEREGVCRT